ncbi:MAG: 3-oxoacyl-ACP synthase [Alphaproteobacteria bacterium]|jgi:3-oxoacyl-[acyl-carrier-protein] synthase-3|nr:3-oxoacyl-ACP synthase [Alphaproteobacteria bacterium]
MPEAYLTAAGAYLPGMPVANDRIADHIGTLDDQSVRLGRLALRQNRIRSRHYAIDDRGRVLCSNAEMAAQAVSDALAKSERDPGDIDLLATATTQGDLLVPGHASAVQAALGIGPVELVSIQTVCAGALIAAKAAALQVMADGKQAAAVVGSENASHWFRPDFYADAPLDDPEFRMSVEYLRWTLSDGAGAILIEPRPNARRRSFRIEWIRLVSLAHAFAPCMVAGAPPERRSAPAGSWSHAPRTALADGALILWQDMRLLKRIIRAWVGEYLKLVDRGLIDPARIDWLLCHYSAESLREEIVSILRTTGGMIDAEKWFTNLHEKGNTGAAAIFVMLEEFIARDLARPGQSVLCIVPESGRAMVGFMLLTAL